MAAKFRAILTLYSQCHHGYNEGVITDVEIDQLGILIYYIVCYLLYVSECRRTHAFLAFHRQSFPLATILPKMHNGRPCDSLAKEMENRLRLDGGTRSRIDTLHLEQRFNGVLNELDRLKYVVKEHAVECAPEMDPLLPPAKKYKKHMQ